MIYLIMGLKKMYPNKKKTQNWPQKEKWYKEWDFIHD